ncbi:MAG: hypothetical protein KF686_07945 [Ramlibacter sp.]|nr:hypothetical protein [Ramlibacter sp.]
MDIWGFVLLTVCFVGGVVTIVRAGIKKTGNGKKSPVSAGEVKAFEIHPRAHIEYSRTQKSNAGEPPTTDRSTTTPSSSMQMKGKLLAPLELVYMDTRGVTNHRIVQPYRARANTDYFEAFCHLEESKRSFRFDRVVKATNMQTGELLSQAALYALIHPQRKPPEWLKALPEF